MNIYLHVEISSRELDSKLLLATLAASRGHRVIVSDLVGIEKGVKSDTLLPGIFHTKDLSPLKYKIDFNKVIIAKDFLVTSMDEEGNLNDYGYKVKVRTRWTDDLDPQKTNMTERLANNDSYCTLHDVLQNANVNTTKQSSLFSFTNSKGEYFDVSKLKSRDIGIVVGYRKTLLNGLYETNRTEVINSVTFSTAKIRPFKVYDTTQLDANFNYVELTDKHVVNNKSNNFALLGDNLIGDANSVLFRISDDNNYNTGLNIFHKDCAMAFEYDLSDPLNLYTTVIPYKIEFWSRYIPSTADAGFPVDIIIQGLKDGGIFETFDKKTQGMLENIDLVKDFIVQTEAIRFHWIN